MNRLLTANGVKVLRRMLDNYKLGIDSFLNVITAQTTLLSNRQSLASLRVQQMTASVQLIEALGGGWDDSQLPSNRQLLGKAL